MEQRRHRRLPTSVRVFTRGGPSPFPESAKDISFGGVRVVTQLPSPVGSQSVFSLHLPHDRAPLDLKGQVIWAKDGAMGVSFDQGEPRLSTFVDRLERDASRV
jgi:hypothetical protein